MKLLKRLFNIKDNIIQSSETNRVKVDSDFSVEFYPITKRYYPKYKKYYLQKNINTGIMNKLEEFLFTYADYGTTEAEADKLIELFKEQRLKKNVTIIPK